MANTLTNVTLPLDANFDPKTAIAQLDLKFISGPNKGLQVHAKCHAVDLVLDCDTGGKEAVLAILADSTSFTVIPQDAR